MPEIIDLLEASLDIFALIAYIIGYSLALRKDASPPSSFAQLAEGDGKILASEVVAPLETAARRFGC